MNRWALGELGLLRSILLAAAITAAGVSTAAIVTLQPNDGKDAQITPAFGQSNSNFGSFQDLITNWGDNGRSVGLVEFDLSTLPAGANVTSATLSLFHEANSCSGCRYDVFRITSAWSESTVTFNTAPTFNPVAVASLVIGGVGAPGVFRDWDVTSVVQGWLSGSFANFGLWVEEIPVAGSASAYFDSSDFGGSATDPKLTLQIPEPAALALVGLGLAALGVSRRRSR